tara:strand:- start:215 stop:805 length:591 start_codon:yes stop_codon:yes gene_type:complete
MNKKIIIQLVLLIILLVIILSVFFIYFKSEKKPLEEITETSDNTKLIIDEETATLINNLNYSFSDTAGNYYELSSEIGKIDINDSNKMFMTNVKAFIYLKNSSPIKIVSKYANYNKESHETSFFENVVLTYLNHKANSENLDISFNKNTASMYNNLVYNKPGTQLTADRLEIDLVTKNTKIFMDNKSEKIKIVNKK